MSVINRVSIDVLDELLDERLDKVFIFTEMNNYIFYIYYFRKINIFTQNK